MDLLVKSIALRSKFRKKQKEVENEEKNIGKRGLFLKKVSENCIKVSEKSGNFWLFDEWQPCNLFSIENFKFYFKSWTLQRMWGMMKHVSEAGKVNPGDRETLQYLWNLLVNQSYP